MGFCNCSMFCCTLLYVHSSFAIILMGKRELIALLCLPPWCLVTVVWLFLTMPWVCLQFVIVIYPDHAHLLFFRLTIIVALRLDPDQCQELIGPFWIYIVCIVISTTRQQKSPFSYLGQFSKIRWNQTTDVHRGF